MQRSVGLLTLYIQHEAPEGEKRANWIPVPAGPFFMAGRFYDQEALLIDGLYKIPECKMSMVVSTVSTQTQGSNLRFAGTRFEPYGDHRLDMITVH